jgi:hypothetical protein
MNHRATKRSVGAERRSWGEAERRESGAEFSGRIRAAFPIAQELANEVNKGDKAVKNDLEDLKRMRVDLDGYIHQAATVAERERLTKLENEVSEDRKKVEELRAKAYEIAMANKAQIKIHSDAITELRNESIDMDVDAWQLEQGFSTKQQEMFKLQKIIKDKEAENLT